MSTTSLDYTGGYIQTVGAVKEPSHAARLVFEGMIPANLVDFSKASNNFRDATIAHMLTVTTANNNYQPVIDTLSNAIRCSMDGTNDLTVFVDYLASIAYAWEQHELAAKAIMRRPAEITTEHVWSIVAAMKKNMPTEFYKSLVIAEGSVADVRWVQEAAEKYSITI